MKKFTCLLILSSVLFGCSPSEVDYNLVQDRGGIAYLPNESEPFTGTAVASYPSGQQQIVVSYENGKPSGISSEWYANGQMKSEQHFSGEDEGRIRDWYENGEVARDIRVLDGMLVGRNIWKSPEFDGEINASNGLVDGTYIYKTNTNSTTSNYSKGILKQIKQSWKSEGSTSNTERHFEHRYEGTQSRLIFYKRKFEYISEYSHHIEESELDYSQGQIVTKTLKKDKDEQEFSTDTKKETNEWEDASLATVSVEAQKDRVLLESDQYIESVSLKTGKVDGKSWGINEKWLTSNSYDQGILNGWDISFDREKASWDDDPNCYISGDWEYEAKKCEIAFGKSKTPDDSIIPQRFKVLIENDKKKVAEALIKKTKVEKERKRKAEIEKKKQEEAEKKRRIKAEKKRKAEEEKQRIINAKKTEERLALELERFKKELMSNDQMCVDKASYSETLFGLATVSDSCNDAIQSAFDIYKNGDQSLAISAINDIQNDSRICKRDYEKCLLEKNKKAMELSLDTSQFNKDSDVTPVYVAGPQYPRRAQVRGKQGYAIVEFTITTTGGVRDSRLLEEYPEGWGFGGAALKAADKLRYVPKIVNGVTQEIKNVRYKYSFSMAQ